jgi:predicted ribosome quality control (RQC) complex YloA/Tae2 family protein
MIEAGSSRRRSHASCHDRLSLSGAGESLMKTEQFEGFEILYGTSAAQNDRISTELAEPDDFWLHAAGYAGSHVVVRNPDKLRALPREVEKYAAGLAVAHSKARTARGKIEVHLAWARDVKKPRGFPPGKVLLNSYRSLKVYPPEL